jgi:hypothetical protein
MDGALKVLENNLWLFCYNLHKFFALIYSVLNIFLECA